MSEKARVAIVVLIAAALSSCVISSGHKRGPNGLPVYYLDGMTAGAALRKAEKYCPSGYKTIGTPKQTSALDFIMVIECNPPGGAPMAATEVRAPAQTRFLVPLPDIDISSYCRSMNKATGSTFVQVNCLELEPPAKAWLETHYTTSAIALYCGRVAETSRSYWATKACVEVEEKAQAKLQAETVSPALDGSKTREPAQGTSSWWEQQKDAGKP